MTTTTTARPTSARTAFARTRHSPTEQGKDVISLDDKGKLCAFQLKGGDIDIPRWRREVKPEVDALVENIVEHPAVTSGFAVPFLVTNGRLSEPVVAQVTNLNRSNKRRRLKELRIVVGTDLVSRFVTAHGRFFPREPEDFEAFLRLFLADGRDMLPKSRLARFLQAQLDPGQVKRKTDAARAIASTIILAGYALSAYHRKDNHFALFEGWVLVAAHVARLAETRNLAAKSWQPSFQLALGAAWLAMTNLVSETLSGRELAEGIVMMDGGPPYRARLTILIGMATAFALCQRDDARQPKQEDSLKRFVDEYQRNMLLWGESAIPFFVCLALWHEQCARSIPAEGVVHMLIEAITNLNNPRSGGGFPNPYYGPNRCVTAMCQIGKNPMQRDCPLGASYSLEALIDFLVRRLRKQTLKLLWRGVTRIQLCEMEYEGPTDFYLWRTYDGQLRQQYVKRPQPWSELANQANADLTNGLPATLCANREFAIMIMLVYPHRFCRSLLKSIEDGLANRATC